MTAALSCEVWVDGQRLADTATEYLASTPTALAGLKVDWGRNTVIDQPETSTCGFQVRDKGGDADFLGLLHTGRPVTVWAAGDISAGNDPVDVAVDGWFETTTPTQRLYVDSTAGAVASTDDAFSGERALRLAAAAPAAVGYIGPAPFSTAVDAWDDIPRTAAGQEWTVKLAVRRPAAYRATIAPWLPTSPTRGPAGALLAAKTVTADGWTIYTQTFTVGAAAEAPNTWVGVAVTLDQPTSWAAWPGTWAEQTLTWRDLGSVVVDQLEVMAPPAAQRRVLVFSGRITSQRARAARDGVQVDVSAVDWTADLANTNIGDDPWPAEVIRARVSRILRLAGNPVTATIEAFPAAQKVTWVDVDSQPVMGLLSDLAVTSDAVLWSAWTSSRGFYLWYEDPARRSALRLLALDPDTGLVEIVGNPSPSNGIYLSACWIDRNAVELSQDVTDVITRVDLTWAEQTVDDDGLPAPTERHILVVDQVAEAEFGTRRVGYSTQLTTAAAGQVIADRILNRSRALGWKSDGFTWDTRIPLDGFDDRLRTAALDLLDGTKRIGAPIVVDQMPDWAPSGPIFGAYLEGGSYTYTGGRWILETNLSPSGFTGQSTRWVDLPTAWTWVMFDPDIAWFHLLGTTTTATAELEAA